MGAAKKLVFATAVTGIILTIVMGVMNAVQNVQLAVARTTAL